MKIRLTLQITFGLIAVLAMVALAGTPAEVETHTHASVGQQAPNFTLMDANGKNHTLADLKGKFVVLEWINFGCPFVIKHYGSGNMQNLQVTYSKKDVVWLSICSSAPGKQGYFEGDKLKSAIKDNGSKSAAYLIDSDGKVGEMYAAKTTPNMYIISPEGVLIYAGAIDDKPSVKQSDIKGSVNFVSSALDLAMSGKEVKVKATQPYGCSVKYAKK